MGERAGEIAAFKGRIIWIWLDWDRHWIERTLLDFFFLFWWCLASLSRDGGQVFF